MKGGVNNRHPNYTKKSKRINTLVKKLCCNYVDATPSLSQAQRLREFSRQVRLNADVMYAVISEEKADQKEQIRFPKEAARFVSPGVQAAGNNAFSRIFLKKLAKIRWHCRCKVGNIDLFAP